MKRKNRIQIFRYIVPCDHTFHQNQKNLKSIGVIIFKFDIPYGVPEIDLLYARKNRCYVFSNLVK